MSAIFGATHELDDATRTEMARRLAGRGPGPAEPATSGPGSPELVATAGAESTRLQGMDVMADGLALGAGEPLATRVAAALRGGGETALGGVAAEFAAVVADRERGRVLLVRDRVGSRPLYYARTPDGWAFASEYKALLALDGLAREVDAESLMELHRSKTVPRGRTLIAGVLQVPPGCVVELDADRADVRRYWQPALDIDPSLSLEAGGAALAERLVQAVADRAEAGGDGGPGLALSGGVDSMVLLGAAERAGLRPRTYSIGDAATDPELEWARRIAEHFGTEHREAVLDPSALATDLPALVWALEDPIARTETLLTMQLCGLAASECSVMIRGDGADGLLGGMDRHKLLALGGRLRPFARDIWELYDHTQTGSRPRRPLARLAVAALLRDRIPAAPLDGPAEPHLELPSPLDGELLNRVLVAGPEHALPMLLQKAERSSRHAGVTPTAPFTDDPVMQLCFRFPSRLKNDGRRNKIVLREAARHLIPESFATRPKHPQRVSESPAFCDLLADLASRLDLAAALPQRGPFDRDRLARLLARPDGGQWAPEHAMRIWTLALTEIWFRTFIDADGAAPIRI